MKFNKLKLTALCMSALMVASTVPMTGWAEELTSGEELTSYEELGAAEVVVPVSATIKATMLDVDSIKFYYGDPEIPDGTVTYNYNKIVDGEMTDEIDSTETAMATVKEFKDSTCSAFGEIRYEVVIDNVTYPSELYQVPKKPHTKKVLERFIEKVPTCEEDGEGYEHVLCTVCNEEFNAPIDTKELAKRGHWTDGFVKTATRYEDLQNVVVSADGKATLVDPTHGGSYYVRTYDICTRMIQKEEGAEYEECGEEIMTSEELIVLKPDHFDGEYGEVVKLDNIEAGIEIGDVVTPDNIPDGNTIQLKDCSKEGTITVEYYISKDDKTLLHTENYKVDPHHTLKNVVIEFDTDEDAKQCTVIYDGKGGYTITNNHCALPIKYYEVYHCVSSKCPASACTKTRYAKPDSRGSIVSVELHPEDHLHAAVVNEKERKPEGPHHIDQATKAELDTMAKNGELTYEVLNAYAKNNQHIRLGEMTATCTKAGKYQVIFLCKLCKCDVLTVEYDIPAIGHNPQKPVRENLKPATCENDGSYDSVVYCTNSFCDAENKEIGRVPVILPRLAHSNEIRTFTSDHNKAIYDDDVDNTLNQEAKMRLIGSVVVDVNGWLKTYYANGWDLIGDAGQSYWIEDPTFTGIYDNYKVRPELYTNCSVCGKHPVVIDEGPDSFKITSLKALDPGQSCNAGSISLKATYRNPSGEIIEATGTYPYYTSINEYQRGISEHIPGETVKENIVEPTEEADGSYDEVVYCTRCEAEISRKTVVVPKTVPEKKLAAVTNLKATVLGTGRVSLSWDASEGADGYIVLGLNNYRTGSQIGYSLKTTYVDRSADADDFNFYWVIPFYKNDAGKNVLGELSNYVYALARVIGNVDGIRTYDGEGTIDVAWNAASNATSYVVLSKTGSSTAAFNAPVTVKGNSYTDKVEAGTVKFYWVYGVYTNADGKVMAAGPTSTWTWGQAK